jgi:3-hydroxyisobutyrate dehydrogenase-like beta-hydroxyacid dehydrogenase
MKITVIGTGNMGSAFLKQLSQAGHSVRVTGRDAAKAQAAAAPFASVEAVAPAEAVLDSEIVILATGNADAIDA